FSTKRKRSIIDDAQSESDSESLDSDNSSSTNKKPKASEGNHAILSKLVGLVTWLGYYKLNSQLANVLGKSLFELQSAIPVKGLKEELWATALVLAFLELKLKEIQEDWRMMADKSRKWLFSEMKKSGITD